MTYLSASIGIDAESRFDSLTDYVGQVEIRDGRNGSHIATIISANPDAHETLAAALLTTANLLRAKASAGAGETDDSTELKAAETDEAPAEDVA